MPLDPVAACKTYLKEVERARQRGDATEHTYRPFFIGLMNAVAPKALTTNEPKRSAAGAPDFIVTTHKCDLTLGYIEAKDVGVSLDEAEKSEQLRRYRRSLPNLLFTDYLELRWYVDGERRATARLARLSDSGKLTTDATELTEALTLIRDFATQAPQGIDHPEELARRMARTTHLIRDLIVDEFASGRVSPLLQSWHKAFEQTLLPDLKHEDFADMFAQTLAYGLFSARVMGGGNGFNMAEAQKRIPRTNPFLHDFFYLITGPRLSEEPFSPFVADLVQTLDLTDIYALLENFGKKSGRADPMLHFYETFLGAYDPKLKEMRGVYYTPEPVVGWLVRSVDFLLKDRFGLKDGVADATRAGPAKDAPHRVLILDPATGTATFLYAIIRFIREQFIARNDAGQWPGYVQRDLLPRLFGFELLMAPYAVAHFKLGLELAARDLDQLWREHWSYEFHANERLHIYLTNTLDDAGHKLQQLIGPAEAISREAEAAAAVKAKLPVLVVLGNPPYSGHSANEGEWIKDLVRDYYSVDGQPLGERNSKWLQDDYVKFIRWAQWRIQQTGAGILAYVTNHGYLDNPTFRGMRQQLMEAFDEIWLVDLHGNTKKNETAPDGGRDQNVFDIQQGVALGVFVRLPAKPGEKKKPAKVRHTHLWGERADKYAWLDAHDVKNTKWTTLKPQSPNYWFFPRESSLADEYDAGWKLDEFMPVTTIGPNSHRDDFAIAFDHQSALARLNDLRDPSISPADFLKKYDLTESKDWSVAKARGFNLSEARPVECLYRPFDHRYMLYGRYAFDRPRPKLCYHIESGSVALISTRQTKESFAVFATAKLPGQHKLATPYDGSYLSPLYLYPDAPKPDDSLLVEEPGSRRPNLDEKFISAFTAKLKLKFVDDGLGDLRKTFGPEAVFQYAYAIFHSPSYRERYAEFLKVDFPRLQLTSDPVLFRHLCGYGKDLLDLHLLKNQGALRISYPSKGSNIVDDVSYEPPRAGQPGRVRINVDQWFEGVTPEAWDFRIGGYQVAEKWLKDRKGRQLSIDERRLYPQIVAALAETARIMRDIDAAIATAGGWPLK
ncbi:MAG: type ISP restriction/modification enzyme [Verrucomicrobiota bacterium]